MTQLSSNLGMELSVVLSSVGSDHNDICGCLWLASSFWLLLTGLLREFEPNFSPLPIEKHVCDITTRPPDGLFY